jgi:glycine oxidase
MRAGNLDTALFLEQTRKFLEASGSYRDETFDFNSLKIAEHVSYKDIKAPLIVFAEGYLIKNNPLFSYLPFKPAKGEILTIESADLETGTDILNKNAFIMPIEKKRFKAGATYNWEELNDVPTEKGLRELEEKLGKITNTDHKIISHSAGVRPSVIDRRPVLGRHPDIKNACVFNGMGTKGVMLAPWFAKHLALFLFSREDLMPEVNVSRFIGHFQQVRAIRS